MPKISGKKSPSKGKGDRRTIHYSILVAVGLIVAVPLIISVGTLFGIAPYQTGSTGTGYCKFLLIDTQNSELVNGQVALTRFDTGELVGIYDTDSMIHVEDSVLATIYSVDLKSGDSRTFLPFTIVPDVSGEMNDPKINTIAVYFLYPPENISVEIAKLDGIEGRFNESHVSADVEHEIELSISVETPFESTSLYGASSFVPDLFLPEKSASEGISGFGLWLWFNNTEIITDSVLVENYPSNAYYIESGSYSIILLHPVFFDGQDQTVSFELKQQPTEIGIFQGFIDDFQETFLQIV